MVVERESWQFLAFIVREYELTLSILYYAGLQDDLSR